MRMGVVEERRGSEAELARVAVERGAGMLDGRQAPVVRDRSASMTVAASWPSPSRVSRGRLAALAPGRSRRHIGGPARLEGVMAPSESASPDFAGLVPVVGADGRRGRWRAPWRRGAWTPEEVAVALRSRRVELLGELRRQRAVQGVAVGVLEEIVDDAMSIVVMKPRAIRDEEHLRRAFWLSVKLLLARYREGRHEVRVGSRDRADFEAVARVAVATGRSVAEEVELRDRMARAADFMAQLDELEVRVTTVMAVRGAGIRAAARELGVPLKTVKAAAHSAQAKLEQVAAIAAAGRMCGYRERAIAAHVAGAARAQDVRVARAHIAACPACRRTYVRLVREMGGREFQRRASAAFLPLPALAGSAHPGWMERLAAFLSARLPGNGVHGGGVRERALASLGGSAGAVKTAGVLAGTTVIVVGAASGIHELNGSHRSRSRVHHAQSERPYPVLGSSASIVSSQARPSGPVRGSAASGALARAGNGGFSYLGGNGAVAHRRDVASVAAVSSGTGRARSFDYLGGNAPRSSPAPVAQASSVPSAQREQASTGGQFSP
jgi:DNA-directed RNA polymerase specialized sigma24 family protein